jgi:hypothetical protein
MIQTISSFYRHSLAADPTADVRWPTRSRCSATTWKSRRALSRSLARVRRARGCERGLRAGHDPATAGENSIKYAVSATTRPVTISISARSRPGCWC